MITPGQAQALLDAGAINDAQFAQITGVPPVAAPPPQIAAPQTPAPEPIDPRIAALQRTGAPPLQIDAPTVGLPTTIPQTVAPRLQGNLAVPLTSGSPPATPSITPAPAVAASTSGPSATDLRDAIQARMLAPTMGGGTPARPLGLSPADKGEIGNLETQQADEQRLTDDILRRHQQAVDAFGDQSAALADDAQVGKLLFQQQEQEQAKHREDLDRDTQIDHAKIQAKLTDLESQGIDPMRYLHSMSTGSKIIAGIGLALSSMGSGPVGPKSADHGPDQALDIIRGAIAQDIDAQKSDLARHIELTRMAGANVSENYEHRAAMLKAERESTLSAYSVAMNEVQKRAEMYKDNADIQAGAAKLQGGLQRAMLEDTGKTNEQLYALKKGAERIVGGTGGVDIRGKVIARAQSIRDKAAEAGHDIDPAEAQRQAMAEMGINMYTKGEAPASYAKPQKGANGKPTQRTVDQINAHEGAIENIDELLKLRKKHGGGALLSPDDEARADALAARSQEQLVAALGKTNKGLLDRTSALIPDHPLDTKISGIVGSDTIGMRLREAKKMLQEENARLTGNVGERDHTESAAAELGGKEVEDE